MIYACKRIVEADRVLYFEKDHRKDLCLFVFFKEDHDNGLCLDQVLDN